MWFESRGEGGDTDYTSNHSMKELTLINPPPHDNRAPSEISTPLHPSTPISQLLTQMASLENTSINPKRKTQWKFNKRTIGTPQGALPTSFNQLSYQWKKITTKNHATHGVFIGPKVVDDLELYHPDLLQKMNIKDIIEIRASVLAQGTC